MVSDDKMAPNTHYVLQSRSSLMPTFQGELQGERRHAHPGGSLAAARTHVGSGSASCLSICSYLSTLHSKTRCGRSISFYDLLEGWPCGNTDDTAPTVVFIAVSSSSVFNKGLMTFTLCAVTVKLSAEAYYLLQSQ